jgi:hypothetical protein
LDGQRLNFHRTNTRSERQRTIGEEKDFRMKMRTITIAIEFHRTLGRRARRAEKEKIRKKKKKEGIQCIVVRTCTVHVRPGGRAAAGKPDIVREKTRDVNN